MFKFNTHADAVQFRGAFRDLSLIGLMLKQYGSHVSDRPGAINHYILRKLHQDLK
jgi:hypothetical protein